MMPFFLLLLSKNSHRGEEGAHLLNVMRNVSIFLLELSNQVKHGIIRLLKPRMLAVELVAENQSHRVITHLFISIFLLRCDWPVDHIDNVLLRSAVTPLPSINELMIWVVHLRLLLQIKLTRASRICPYSR